MGNIDHRPFDICSDECIGLDPDIPDHLSHVRRVQPREGPSSDLGALGSSHSRRYTQGGAALSTLGDVVLWLPGEGRDS